MKVLDPGHDYLLDNLDGDEKTRLTFVKREGEMYPGNESAYEGTNMQEVLRALIDRCCYVNNQITAGETINAAWHLRQAFVLLELRAARRHGRELDGVDIRIMEKLPVCKKCGHVGCSGECHHAGSL